MMPTKSLLFRCSQFLTVMTLGLTSICFLLLASPIIKALSLILIPVIIGLLTPINSKKRTEDIDRLAIQRINRKSLLQNVITDMPFAVFGGVILAVLLLFINALLPIGLENKIGVAIAILGSSLAWPFCYRGAEAASVKYAETLK